MKALLIEFDLFSGLRAGDISPRDPKLPCRGWQNLDRKPALEIRLVQDNRDLSQYEGVQGVTVLDGKDAINAAIQANIPSRFQIVDKEVMIEHMKEKGVSFNSLVGKGAEEIAKFCLDQGVAGVLERKPELLE